MLKFQIATYKLSRLQKLDEQVVAQLPSERQREFDGSNISFDAN